MVATHDCYTFGVTGHGDPNADVLLLGISPGKDEWQKTHRPFTGQSGQLLDATLDSVGWSRDKSFATNLICWWNNEPDFADIAECSSRLQDEIANVNPRLIVCFGKVVSEQITGEKFGKVRGCIVWSNLYQCWILCTYHPAALLYPGGHIFVNDFVRDLMKVPDVVTWELDPERSKIDYTCLNTLTDAQDALEALQSAVGYVALDVETRYKTEPKGDLLCLSISSELGTWVIDGDIAKQLDWSKLTDLQWTFHNGPFDVIKLKQAGIILPLVHDTLMMSYALDERGGKEEENERSVGIHGLKKLAREYIGAPDYDLHSPETYWDRDEKEKVRKYNAQDAGYTRWLANLFWPRICADNVDSVYNDILMPALRVIMEQTEYGCFIDRIRLAELGKMWIPKWLEYEKDLCERAQAVGFPGKPNLSAWQDIAKVIYDYFKMPLVKRMYVATSRGDYIEGRTTMKQGLEQLETLYPEMPGAKWIHDLRVWREVDRLIGTYITGIEDDIDLSVVINDRLGLIHPEGLLHGARSGRMSYHKPPVQTIPKYNDFQEERGLIRSMFVAKDDDHVILECDYKQAELWMAAYLSGDEQMLADLRTGDPHSIAAEFVFGVKREDFTKEEWKVYRYNVKRISFGIMYARGAKSLADYLGWTYQKATEYIKRWKTRYATFVKWSEQNVKKALDAGELVTITGRKRRYHVALDHSAIREMINMPIQSGAHDYLLNSMTKLHYLLKPLDAHVWFEVHDALIIHAPKQYLKEVIRLIKHVMEEPKFGFPGIPVEIGKGPNWHEVEPIEEDEINAMLSVA